MGSVGAQRIGGGSNLGVSPTVVNRLTTEAYNYERYHMSGSQTSVSNINIESIGQVNEDGMADVTYSYDANVRIPVGVDPETGRLEIEYDTETRRNTNRFFVGSGDNVTATQLSNMTTSRIENLVRTNSLSPDLMERAQQILRNRRRDQELQREASRW